MHFGGLFLGLWMGNVAHMQNKIRVQNLLQGGTKGRHQLGRQIRDKANRIGQYHL